jgi:rRNA-processing protein EBP2
MVTKSKLKMALAAEKGVDFKKLHQKKVQRAARKEKAGKGGEGKGKKTQDEWEDVPEENESDDSEDGGAVLEDDEEESADEDEGMKVWNPASRRRPPLTKAV